MGDKSIWSSGLSGRLVYLVIWSFGLSGLSGRLVCLVCLVNKKQAMGDGKNWSIWSSGLFGLSSHLVYRNRQGAMGRNGLSGHLVYLVEQNEKGKTSDKDKKPKSTGGRARII